MRVNLENLVRDLLGDSYRVPIDTYEALNGLTHLNQAFKPDSGLVS